MVFWKQVQKNVNGSADILPDTLPDLPVSLVLTSLIVVDIIEKLRTYSLRGRQKSKYFFNVKFFKVTYIIHPSSTLLSIDTFKGNFSQG